MDMDVVVVEAMEVMVELIMVSHGPNGVVEEEADMVEEQMEEIILEVEEDILLEEDMEEAIMMVDLDMEVVEDMDPEAM